MLTSSEVIEEGYKIVTSMLPQIVLEKIDQLYMNRSKFVRAALRVYLQREHDFLMLLKNQTPKQLDLEYQGRDFKTMNRAKLQASTMSTSKWGKPRNKYISVTLPLSYIVVMTELCKEYHQSTAEIVQFAVFEKLRARLKKDWEVISNE